MADCNETLAEIWNFFDDQLSESAKLEIHEHLGGCTDCLSAFDFYAELRVVISNAAQRDEIPESLMLKIQQCFGDVFADEDASELRFDS